MKIEKCKLLFLLLLGFAMYGCQRQVPPVATTLDSTESKEPQPLVGEVVVEGGTQESASNEFVIDVRSQEEWDAGHLLDAVWIPHTEITERIGEVTEDKSAKLVLY